MLIQQARAARDWTARRGQALAAQPATRSTRTAGRGYRTKGLAPDARAVSVKVIVRDRKAGVSAGMVAGNVRYIGRDRGEEREVFGNVTTDAALRDWQHDRRLFHVVVAPNDGRLIDDMQGFVRDVVSRWETVTGPLEWVAAVHDKADMAHAQGNRHAHVLIRGVQDDRDLTLSPALFHYGLREMAREAATERLGPMSEREIRELEQQRLDMRDLRIETGAMGSKRDLADLRREERQRELTLDRGGRTE